MKNKIHYSSESRRDLDDIWDYIVSVLQNRSAAERVIDRIMDAVDPLKNFAEMGTPLSSIADVGTDYRFLVSGNYMVFYRVQGNYVYIDRVLYLSKSAAQLCKVASVCGVQFDKRSSIWSASQRAAR